MMSLTFNGTLDWAIIFALVGISVTFFGKIILINKKDLVNNRWFEYFYGMIFIIYLVLVPILLIVVFLQPTHSFFLFLFYIIEAIFLLFYYWLAKKVNIVLKYIFSLAVTIFSILVIYLSYLERDFLYVVYFVILTFFILIMVAVDLAQQKRFVNILLDNKVTINGEILHMGEDFIGIESKKQKVAINKAHIVWIGDIKNDKEKH